MKNKMIKISTKVMSAMIAASIVISSTTIPTYAAELPTEVQETAIETVVEAPEVEGQGDIIDDEFAYVEGQGDVIDDEFAYVEGQGDVIDDEFAVAPEAEVQPATETSTEAPADNKVVLQTTNGTYEEITVLMPGQGNFYNPIKDGVIDPISLFPVEGQGDVIDDEFAYVEGQGDVIDDEFAVAPEAEAQPATDSLVLVEAPVVDVIMNEVEGQGDVIDDEFAVAPEAEVAENDTEVAATSVKSFVAVGSADEAQKAEETKKDDDDLVFTFNPFNPIVPFRAVPSGNQSEKKSDALETVQTINKFINPSDSVYGNPIRELIDDSDVLGADEKEYLKNSTSLMIGADEGMACADFLPLWGSLKKVGKMSESLVKLHDSKTTADQINNTIDVVQNIAEGVVCAIPGGGLALNAYKAQMEFGSYCFKKVCRFVDWLF